MTLPADLNKIIKQLSNNLDGRVDGLVKAIENYQLQYENAILKAKFELDRGYLTKSTKNFLKAQGIDLSKKWKQISEDYVNDYDQVGKTQIDFNKELKIDVALAFTDITIINKLKAIDLEVMYQQGALLDSLIKKQLINAVALGSKFQDTVDNLATDLLGAGEKTGQLARFADTYMRTSMFGLSRAIDKEIYDDAIPASQSAEQKYLYAGPIDNKTREFCIEHVGETFTESEIEQFPDENDSGLDPWFSPGGWNCRHRLIPVDE